MDTTHKLSVASLLDFQLAFDTQVNLKRKLEENEKLMKDMACHLLNKVGILLNLNICTCPSLFGKNNIVRG